MWKETKTPYGFHLVENEGGKTLAYDPSSGVKLIEKDGFVFKDLAKTGELLPYEDWRLPMEERAEDLAKRLSVEQIAGLMCFSAHQREVARELTEDQTTFLDKHLRCVLNSAAGASSNEAQIAWSNSMQAYVEGKDFGIPCYISSDPRNGKGVADWPGNLGLAATFDPQLTKESAMCQSKELRDLGVACFLAPQVDLACEPRWWRNSGTFGEDPALSRDLSRAFCDGLQSTYGPDGEDLGWGKDSVTAMVKHWTGEGASEGGREAHTEGGKYAVYPNNNFETMMIPFVDGAFQLDGKTGMASSVMASYTAAFSADGSLGDKVGSSFSDYKINQLLRKRYGFSGSVCTDWMVLNDGFRCCGWGQDVIEKKETTPGERALMSIMAGVDQMGGCSNPDFLVDAYKLGCEKYGKEVMDEAFAVSARRLLISYFVTGLFENPYLDEAACLADVDSEEKQAAAMAAQIKSVVMIKNTNGAIKKQDKRLKVYIPATYTPEHWAEHFLFGIFDDPATVDYPLNLESARKYFDVVTDHVEGLEITRASEEELKDCDLFLLPISDPKNACPQDGRNKEGEFIPKSLQFRPYIADGPYVRKVSIAGDTLPDGSQENRSYYGKAASVYNECHLDQLLEAAALAKKLGIPSVAAINTGNPFCVYEFEPAVDAILVSFGVQTHGGGTFAHDALFRVACGMDEPSGLLPMQMPKDMDDVERQAEDTPRDMECYTDTQGNKYDFAFGMNYAGVIRDARVEKYAVAPLTRPGNMGK